MAAVNCLTAAGVTNLVNFDIVFGNVWFIWEDI